MRALTLSEHCEPDALMCRDVAEPDLKGNEVLVELKAAAMNHLDLWVRKGVPGHKFPLPLILGSDGAGIVADKGDGVGEDISTGDRVALMPGISCNHCYACHMGEHQLCRSYGLLGETRDGTNAEFIAVPSENVIPMPDSMSFDDAAAVPLTFLTAWHMLTGRAKVQPWHTVLVHGAGSGVSVAAIQIAKLFNATVLATTSTEQKMQKAAELGADHVFNYKKQDVAVEIFKKTAKEGVDIVIDHVGQATFDVGIGCLKKGGALVTCGTTSGPELKVHGPLLFFKGLSVLGSTMGNRGEQYLAFQQVARGRMRPVIDCKFPLSEAAAAHAYLESGQQFGKVILDPTM
ncbi:zinc-binding dehydrogenase [Planctomycetota bacterium]